MIQATFYKDSDNSITGFQIKGHAGYAESGQDIVCAAVSALAVNTVNSIEAFTEDGIQVDVDEDTGFLSLSFTSQISRESEFLLKSLELGLQGIQKDYKKKYITVQVKEV